MDNQAAIYLVQDHQYHKKSKHIDLRYRYVKEKLERKEVEIRHCPSAENEADILTKALPKPQFQKLRSLAGNENEHNYNRSRTAGDGPRDHQ